MLSHGGVPLDSHCASARPSRRGPAGLVRRVLGVVLGNHKYRQAPSTTRHMPLGSAVAAAVVAQQITGPGSGPYSGTPFRPASGAAADPQRTTAGSEVSEAARHDHGIIDHSRHVSSIGRR